MSLDPIGDRIAEIDAEQQRLRAEREELERKHGRPEVTPVLHYWQYHHKHDEPEEGYTLERAWRYMDYAEQEGHMSADGISVNGVYFDKAQLRKMFRDEED